MFTRNCPAADPDRTALIIWTTTPWTIPANQALNVHPEFTYALVDVGDKLLVLAEELVESCLERYELSGEVIATTHTLILGGRDALQPVLQQFRDFPGVALELLHGRLDVFTELFIEVRYAAEHTGPPENFDFLGNAGQGRVIGQIHHGNRDRR